MTFLPSMCVEMSMAISIAILCGNQDICICTRMPFYNDGKELRRDLETFQCWKVGSGGQLVIPLKMRVHIMTYASEQNNVEESED